VIRRTTLKPEQPVAADQVTTRYRCGSCGATIPKLATRPFVCSYCADDVRHGTDGYLVDILKEWIAEREAWLEGREPDAYVLASLDSLKRWRVLVAAGEAHLAEQAERGR